MPPPGLALLALRTDYDLFAGRFAVSASVRCGWPGRGAGQVLLVGAGTGLDLPELRACGEVLATDISPVMLARLSRRAARLGMTVNAGDGRRGAGCAGRSIIHPSWCCT